MNKKLWLLFCVCSFHVFIAQQRDPSIILYDRGNAAVARKDYRTADSLFTLSLNTAPHPDSYYNRAVCRRQLNDFKGYCLDLNSASEFGDTEAKSLYWKQCATADTIYKKNNGEIATKVDGEIIEYVTTYKYNTNFEYKKCDTAKNVILSKIRVDNSTIYRNCKEITGSKYIGGTDSLIKFIQAQTDFSKKVEQKNLAGAAFISVITDENGKVKDLKITYGEKDEAIAELFKGLMNTPNWSPALYGDKAVKFQTDISVSYYDKELSIFSNSFLNKDSTLVEVMPEFPGGPMEMMRYIQKNIKYPQMAKETGLQGKCFLRFVVLPNGKITNVVVLRGVPGCLECDREAMRVIKTMSVWKPGTQNGKPVPVFFNLPINFYLR